MFDSLVSPVLGFQQQVQALWDWYLDYSLYVGDEQAIEGWGIVKCCPSIPQQVDGFNCGAFAMAFTIAIANNYSLHHINTKQINRF